MSDHPREHDDEFAERVAHVLRAPEHLDDDFERSLVAAIRADRPLGGPIAPRGRVLSSAWWKTPRPLHLSPIATLAMAASIAVIAALGALKFVASPAPVVHVADTAPAAASTDTVTLVRFVFIGQAKSVALVGDFNAWGAEPTPLHSTTVKGAWSVSVPVSSGRHEYAFIVDGKRWTPDPYAPTSTDDFDTKSSVLMVGS